jgi:hypothetical protein
MKKYLMGFVVLLMAGLTAFSVNLKKEPASTNLDTFYWYAVTYNASHPDGAVLSSADSRFSGVEQTQTYADSNDGCSGTAKDCLRGFSSPLSSFPSEIAPNSITTKN